MKTRLLTYQELGAALNVSPAAAKRLAKRRGWPKALGSDGRSQVAVPVDHLPEESALASPAADAPNNQAKAATASPLIAKDEVDDLRRQVRGLEAKLILVELERDQIASEAAETIRALTEISEELSEALRCALDTRDPPPVGDSDTRTERLIQEKDPWHRIAADRLEKLRVATQSRPARIRSFLRWLRAASPL